MRVKSGISVSHLSKLGKNGNVSTEVLIKICTALGCNADEIMDITDIKIEKK